MKSSLVSVSSQSSSHWLTSSASSSSAPHSAWTKGGSGVGQRAFRVDPPRGRGIDGRSEMPGVATHPRCRTPRTRRRTRGRRRRSSWAPPSARSSRAFGRRVRASALASGRRFGPSRLDESEFIDERSGAGVMTVGTATPGDSLAWTAPAPPVRHTRSARLEAQGTAAGRTRAKIERRRRSRGRALPVVRGPSSRRAGRVGVSRIASSRLRRGVRLVGMRAAEAAAEAAAKEGAMLPPPRTPSSARPSRPAPARRRPSPSQAHLGQTVGSVQGARRAFEVPRATQPRPRG